LSRKTSNISNNNFFIKPDIFDGMVAKIIKNIKNKVLIVGPIYDKLNKLSNVIIDNYDLIILNGNVSYPNDNVENRINVIEELIKTNKVIYNLGNFDLKNNLNWFKNKPNVVIIEFARGTKLIITSGGITPQMKSNKLMNDLETTFVSNIDNKPWHDSYNGSHGYVISNNPLTNKYPQFYNYSAQIGNTYESGKVYAQEADANGLLQTIAL
jgi:hypothetical protein